MAKRQRIPRVHEPAPDSAPPPPRYRWIIPRSHGSPIAHKALVGAERTVCSTQFTDGAVYPPAPEIPRCETCKAAPGEASEVKDG